MEDRRIGWCEKFGVLGGSTRGRKEGGVWERRWGGEERGERQASKWGEGFVPWNDDSLPLTFTHSSTNVNSLINSEMHDVRELWL